MALTFEDVHTGAQDADLERFLAACGDENATRDAVTTRADQLARKIGVSDDVVNTGKKLYYRLLRDICLKEEERLKRSTFAPLLKDGQMHRALLAICFEVVMHVHAPLAKPFPGVLRVMEVSEFELLVMIENINLLFELSKVQMSEGVRRHIRSIQNKVVECEAWKKGSVVLTYLEEPSLAALFNKEEAAIEAIRPSPHRSPHTVPPASPARNSRSMPPPESPLRVGARLPPRHPGTKSGGGAAEVGKGSAGGGEVATALPNIKRQLQAFARRFWLRANDVLSYMVCSHHVSYI
jgi:hypothetical protein